MIIRPWTDADGAEPARVVRAVFDEYGFSWDEGEYCADLYDVRKHYLDQGHLFWVAEHEGVIIGTGALELFPPVGADELANDELRATNDEHLGKNVKGAQGLSDELSPNSDHPHPPPPSPSGVRTTPQGEGGKIRIVGADCSLERLYVHPQARGLGAGSALFQTTIDEARRRGCRSMEIWSDKLLKNAHRLYGHFGAVVVGERICDDPDESPEWGLRLDL